MMNCLTLKNIATRLLKFEGNSNYNKIDYFSYRTNKDTTQHLKETKIVHYSNSIGEGYLINLLTT
jgi:hypothetical protein